MKSFFRYNQSLSERLTEAARRVVQKMPEVQLKKTEKELLNLIQKQQNETAFAKLVMFLVELFNYIKNRYESIVHFYT